MSVFGLHAVWLGTLCAVASASGATAAEGQAGARGRSEGSDPRVQLAAVAHRSVFFGHQSVGMNILDGIEDLARETGVALNVADAAVGAPVPKGTLGHAWVGENERPESKLAAFAADVDALPVPVDVAFVKFCYVDFAQGTDAKALLARYEATLAELRRRHPRTTFVHVTAPVSAVQGGAKALAKRLLGKTPYGLVENVRREEYNALLRKRYAGTEPLFDLARIESTAPDGSVSTVEWKGHVAPALQDAYTDDGGHLNAAGRRRAALGLVAFLASLPERPPAP